MKAAPMRTVLLLAALAALAGCKSDKPGAAALPPARGEGAAPPPKLPDVTRPPAGGGVRPTAGRATGTLFPRAEAAIGPHMGGVITRLNVAEGDLVKKGDILFQIDSRDAALRVAQAKTGLDAANVNLRATQIEYDRTKQLYDGGAATRAMMDQVSARLDAAKVGVTQAQAALNMMQAGVADTTVRSPLDGIVVAKLHSTGEMVTMMPPTVVLVVQDQSTLELRFRLPEEALATVKAGDPVSVHVTALGATRTARVRRLGATVDSRSRTVEVVADVDNSDRTLKPGLLAEVTLGAGK
jgi:RND family efflux transporter MFP subunit